MLNWPPRYRPDAHYFTSHRPHNICVTGITYFCNSSSFGITTSYSIRGESYHKHSLLTMLLNKWLLLIKKRLFKSLSCLQMDHDQTRSLHYPILIDQLFRSHREYILFLKCAIYRNPYCNRKTNKYLSSLSYICLSSWQLQLHLRTCFCKR